MVTAGPARVAAPGPPAFELHTLGWRAFQDLCAAVMRTVLGQSAHAFADSSDAGRDGAFYGVWHDPPGAAGPRDRIDGPFVLQCKHTRKPGSTLSESGLAGEFEKVPPLVERGLCRSYLLMTNARVTGNAEEKILRRLREAGVEHPHVLDGQWVCDTIAANRQLRMFVPRVYGLGDLSQILDERAYEQTSALMDASRDRVATFVITQPYRKAAQALQDHGFVLLLGEPAVGKSVIALMLAFAAADNWQCATVKVRTATELVDRWNPHEPNQFFWADDAFGPFRHEEQLTSDWTRSMPHIMTAISKGAKVVLTSRDYIYQEARPLLKEYDYPRRCEQTVLVNVEDLTLGEREQMLYNHIEQGDQTVQTKTTMKPFLGHAAAADPFRPEIARRLGLRAFTGGLSLTQAGIAEFMTHPLQFLRDVYEQLGADQQAALALVYAAAEGHLDSPPTLDEKQRDIIDRAGSTSAGAIRALDFLTGPFLQATGPPLAEPGWAFRHPTLWEGFASWLPTQSHLLTVVLAGIDDSTLLTRVDCQDEDADQGHGTLLRVPPALYRSVAERLTAIAQQPFISQRWERRGTSPEDAERYNAYDAWRRAFHAFLAGRSSDTFLRIYLAADPGLPGSLVNFSSFVFATPELEPALLARLHQAGVLSEPFRLQAVERMAHLAVTTPDDGWLSDSAWKILLTPDDRAMLMEKVRTELVPRLAAGDAWVYDERDPDDDPVEHALRGYERAFKNAGDFETAQVFAGAYEMHSQLPAMAHEDDSGWSPGPLTGRSLAPPPDTARSIFDDIDAE